MEDNFLHQVSDYLAIVLDVFDFIVSSYCNIASLFTILYF